MKKLKQKIQNICIAIATLLFCNSINAQIVVSNGGTYYVCEGSTYNFEYIQPSGYYIPVSSYGNGSLFWHWGGESNLADEPPSTFNGYTINYLSNSSACSGSASSATEANVTVNTTNPMLVTVVYGKCPPNNGSDSISFTIKPYATTISGTTQVCTGSPAAETYTVTTNVPSPTNYSWSTGSTCWGTGTCNNGSGCTTNTYTVTSICSSSNLQVTVTSSVCPSPSTSDVGTLAVISAQVPATPSGGLTFRQTGSSCQFDATISAVTGATSYIWSESATMSPTICSHGTTTYPCGDFDYGTNYNIYVEASNFCGPSAANPWNHTTPGKPVGCQETPIRPDGEATIQSDFKLYPNPTQNTLNIEYPTASDLSVGIVCTMYDMVGHKIVSWTLPTSQNKVTENTSTFPVGMYMYVINSGKDILTRGKLMIQR